MADDRVTYTVVIDYTQYDESDLHYAEIKKKLSKVTPASKGTASAQFVSIAEA